MSLREEALRAFAKDGKHLDGRPEHKAAKKLEKLAETLLQDIREHVAAGKSAHKMEIRIMRTPPSEHEAAIRGLQEYTRLHEICADPEVDVYIHLKPIGSHLCIVVDPLTEHWLSPDAEIPDRFYLDKPLVKRKREKEKPPAP